MNADRNMAYARTASRLNGLALPVLFLHGAYDDTGETIDSRLAQPMRCCRPDLTKVVVPLSHWMAQENPMAVNVALARFLAMKHPGAWAG